MRAMRERAWQADLIIGIARSAPVPSPRRSSKSRIGCNCRCVIAIREPGSRIAITHLQLQPILDLELRLGEGTGALLAIPIIRSACQALTRMARISDLL